MVQRLWEIRTDADFDKRLGSLGIEPLDKPALVSNPESGSVPSAKTRWLIFDAGDSVKALYVFGSAVKDNSRDGSYNVFTDIFCGLVELYRPHRIVMPVFDRLVRSTDHASQVWAAVRRHCDELLTAEGSLDTRVSGAELNFFIKVLGASSDVQALNMRFLNGRLTKVKNGGCLLAHSQMPFGYRQAADGRVEINPADRILIEAILEGIASRQTPSNIVARVGQLGGSSSRIRALHGPNGTYADTCSNPSGTVGNWVSWIDLWETGTTEMAFACDLRNVDSYRGFEVVRNPHEDSVKLTVPMNWGTPSGGWAPQDLFDRARSELGARRTTRMKRLGGAAHRSRAPFAGLAAWSEGNNDWRLFSRGGSYHLRQRPSTTNGRVNGGWGRGSRDAAVDGEIIARIPARLLHRSLADGIAHAIGKGVNAAETAAAAAVNLHSQPILRSEAAECSAELRRIEAEQRHLLDSISMTESAGVRRELVSRADKIEGDIIEARRRLKTLKPGGTIESDSSAVIGALATLATIEGPTSAHIGDALSQILSNLTLKATQDQVSWSVEVLIPTATGTLRLGPITGTLRLPSTRKRPVGIASRAAELTETLLTTGTTLNGIMEDN
ncbi:MAG TPA: hypothetical protein VFD97_03460, partial [Acidimicrobiia bacterium]|nr:hypothetical protein [Acidimicrobiia bacterium]